MFYVHFIKIYIVCPRIKIVILNSFQFLHLDGISKLNVASFAYHSAALLNSPHYCQLFNDILSLVKVLDCLKL